MSNITTFAQRQRFGRETVIRISTLALFAFVTVSVLKKGGELISTSMLNQDEYCLVSHGKYNGFVYKSSDGSSKGGGMTLANQCLVQSKWMRLAQHSVQLPSSNNEQKIIDDWLWIDYHDRINVLVEAPKTIPGEGGGVSFLIIEQTKYALDSEMSLAVVGGIIEPTTQVDANGHKTQVVMPEAPLMAAQREVEEEMKITCETWVPLGKFRTDVNRGMGWVNPFLARDCSYSSNKEIAEENADIIGGADTETQKVITMSLSDVRQAVIAGRFLEVQWSNTVALAVLRY
ncbi:hypothetical protein ACHAW6_014916 [Cyclotella cf. meneghiniana]